MTHKADMPLNKETKPNQNQTNYLKSYNCVQTNDYY